MAKSIEMNAEMSAHSLNAQQNFETFVQAYPNHTLAEPLYNKTLESEDSHEGTVDIGHQPMPPLRPHTNLIRFLTSENQNGMSQMGRADASPSTSNSERDTDNTNKGKKDNNPAEPSTDTTTDSPNHKETDEDQKKPEAPDQTDDASKQPSPDTPQTPSKDDQPSPSPSHEEKDDGASHTTNSETSNGHAQKQESEGHAHQHNPVPSTPSPAKVEPSSGHQAETGYQQYINRVNNSYKYNPLLLEEILRLSRTGVIREGDVQNLGRKENFVNNQYLDELQQSTDYFRFQYFNPITSEQYYDRLDKQVLALITGRFGAMPDLKASSQTDVESKNQQDKVKKIEQYGENIDHQNMNHDVEKKQTPMSYKPMIYIGLVMVGFVGMLSMIFWKRRDQSWK
ncbi:SdrH family protein [Staphylococcus lutrae]|uniref:SdrH family protein n=1 Tax=Staphylococcus lutrae TaxID=155085 RepID=UPI001469CDCD|nr:SdrH family protein [Staphylococcus lutrae]